MSAPFSIAASSLSFAVLLIAWPAAAQTNAAERNPDPPAAQEGAPAEAADSPEATAEGDAEEKGYVPEDEAAVEEVPAAEASPAPSAASLKSKVRLQDPNRSGRVLAEALLGTLGIAIGSMVGASIGPALVGPFGYSTLMAYVSTFAVMAGGALFGSLSVWVVGSLWRAQGQLGSTLLGGLIGLGVEVAATLAVGLALSSLVHYGILVLVGFVGFAAPLTGAVLGYEASHVKALRSAVTVAPLQIPGGGGVALAWAY